MLPPTQYRISAFPSHRPKSQCKHHVTEVYRQGGGGEVEPTIHETKNRMSARCVRVRAPLVPSAAATLPVHSLASTTRKTCRPLCQRTRVVLLPSTQPTKLRTPTRMPCCMLHSHLACTGVLAHGTKKANRTDPTTALRRSSQAASLASLAHTTTAHCVVPRRIRERGAGSSAPCCRAAHQPRTQQLAVASA